MPTQAEPSAAVPDGLETPSGTQSQVPDPMQAPAEIELRKSQPTQKVKHKSCPNYSDMVNSESQMETRLCCWRQKLTGKPHY